MLINLEKNQKSITYLAVITMLTLFTIITSFSYALLTKDVVGERHYSMQFGKFDLSMQGEENSIQLMNAYPMTDEEGKALTPYKFTITNTGDYEEEYRVLLIEDEEGKASCSGCTFLNPNKLRYEVTIDGIAQTPRAAYTTTVLDRGVLTSNQTKSYELKVWLNYDATIEEENKYYYGKIKVEAYQVEAEYADRVSEKAFASANLGENCKTYDDGVDTFLVGQCSKNYVWYSGKLWRVVLRNNETGAVKMVTDNAMTAIAYNAAGNTTFENSYVDQWLSQEFLPTLHDYQDYLVSNSIWDVSLDSSDTPSRPTGTTIINRTVGLLNIYEYYTTHAMSDGLATCATGYLTNGIYWWLINPYNSSEVKCVNYLGGYLYGTKSINARGVRPSVNLQSSIRITSGNGTSSDPYRLENDKQEIFNGTTLLSTRYSGEYVIFNNELYRIVTAENNLTKIIAVDKPSSLSSNYFHSDDTITNFANASIKTDLETYYQNDTVESYKSMIEPSQTWYLGTIGNGTSYKAGICKTIDAKTSTRNCERIDTIATASIGLPRVGEMFTSQSTKGTKADFWTLTPSSSTTIQNANSYGYLDSFFPSNKRGVRPSMYLKSNVVISSTNTGDGTYEHPYDIELKTE